jgi:hypothetical protein
MQSDYDEELEWLAFRYISNELPADEVELFEQRLAHDQAAREAVAQAVQLSLAVAGAGGGVAPLRRPAYRTIVRWLAAAAAVLIAATMFYRSYRRSWELERVAKFWAKSVAQAEVTTNGDLGLLAGDAASLDEDADVTVPTWVIEAVGVDPDSEKWEDI